MHELHKLAIRFKAAIAIRIELESASPLGYEWSAGHAADSEA